MRFQPDAIHLALFFLLAAGGLGLIAYAVTGKLRQRRNRRNIDAITAAALDYFRKSGVGVAIACISPQQNNRYTAVIESEPMKRFRLSHIIETTLRDHVRKTCGLELEKVYWRFPIREEIREAAASAQDGRPDAVPDEYINEGLEHYKDIPKMEVTELPWEQFEQVTGPAREQNTEPGSAGRSQ